MEIIGILIVPSLAVLAGITTPAAVIKANASRIRRTFNATLSWLLLIPMKPALIQAARCLVMSLLLASTISVARSQSSVERNIIVLDPAHGGQDRGATFNSGLEKDLMLSLAANLRASLAARGIIVFTTRDAELPANAPLLTPDQRAGIANHLHPAACIVLHATPSGRGIHIATSSLPAPLLQPDPGTPIPWETAQAAYIPQSLHLANTLGLALVRAKVPVLLTRTALRPLDHFTCPAIAIEVAPLQLSGDRSIPVADTGYQRRLAEILAAAILVWRNRVIISPPGVTP